MEKRMINLADTSLGIELGSTRIKAVLIDETHTVIALGAHDWENRFEDGYWTYTLDDVWNGIQDAVAQVIAQVRTKYGIELSCVGAFGVSAMMHGYLPFDEHGGQLAAFRTWRNTTTAQAASELTKRFSFHIPQRWSIAHLYQAILKNETHLASLASINTLAGYVHEMLTGKRVLGIGDASGMFPIDSETGDYDVRMAEEFDQILATHHIHTTVKELLPAVCKAGEDAGTLTNEGARRLDPTGVLQAGALACPPEGDAGTGMVATNSVKVYTGNVSAGTSIFAMIVLSKSLSRVYPEIDMVTTPEGLPAAMVHCNTCSSDLDAWVRVFGEMAAASGASLTKSQCYDLFYKQALAGDPDCGGLVHFNYYAGEPITGLEDGCPLLVRRADSLLTFANLARVQLYSAMATLKLGMDLLLHSENVSLRTLVGHGGLFKTPIASQKLMAGALNVPVKVQTTAGEGGPWGMAVLAAYRKNKKDGQTLSRYLDEAVFHDEQCTLCEPDPTDVQGFSAFIERYQKCICVEQEAVKALKQ